MIAAAKGSAIMVIAFFITSVLDYAFYSSMGWLLTAEQFGMLGISFAFLTILSIFVTYGLPWAATKFISEDASKSERNYKIVRSSLLGNFIVAVSVSLIFYLVVGVMKLESIYNPLILIVLLIFVVTSLSNIFTGILRGLFRFKAFATANIIYGILKLLLPVFLVYLGLGVFGALQGILMGAVITLIIAIYLTKDFKFWTGRGWSEASVYRYAMPMFFGMLGITLLMNIDIVAVKLFTEHSISNKLAGFYQSALILGRIPVLLTGALMMVIFPFISKSAKRGTENYSILSLRYAILFIFPISLAIALLPESFIRLFFPEIYLAGAKSLAVLAIGMGFLAILQILANTFQALGRPRMPAVVLVVAVALQLGFLVTLVPVHGIFGAAISTTAACFIGLVILGTIYMWEFGVRIKSVNVLKIFLSFAIAGIFLVLFPHSSKILTLIDLFLAGILYLLILALFNLFTEKDLEIIFNAFTRE